MASQHPVNRWKKFSFHGAFVSRSDAHKKASVTPRAFIREITIRNKRRFAVVQKLAA